eukprot:4729852-Pyramimonas_sp.AAC.1
MAGCSFATTLVRVFIIGPLDKLELTPQVSLYIFIDDYGISAAGSTPEAIFDLSKAAKDLEQL